MNAQIRPFPGFAEPVIKPYTVAENAPAGELVLCYAPMLAAIPTRQAAMWLSGLETVLEKARQTDAELDRRLAAILKRPIEKKPRQPIVFDWLENRPIRPDKPHRANVTAWREGPTGIDRRSTLKVERIFA